MLRETGAFLRAGRLRPVRRLRNRSLAGMLAQGSDVPYTCRVAQFRWRGSGAAQEDRGAMSLPNFIVEATRDLLVFIGRFADFVILAAGTLLICWWLIFRKR